MIKLFPSAPPDFSFEDLIRRGEILPLLLRRYVEESIVALVPLSTLNASAQKDIV